MLRQADSRLILQSHRSGGSYPFLQQPKMLSAGDFASETRPFSFLVYS
jgi:hypothetical protein